MSDKTLFTKTPFPKIDTKEDLKQEVGKCLDWKNGHVRGISLKTDSFKAIELMGGEGCDEEVQKLLRELDTDIEIEKIHSHEWYPAGYGPAMYLVASYLFSWKEKEIEELGLLSTRGSMLIKIIMRLVSVRAALYGGPSIWHKYYDFGELMPVEHSEDEQFIQFQIKGYDVHPINEFYHAGYFRGITELVTGGENVIVEVLQSIYMGGEYSEYKISW